jgi:hypothetical protein
LTDALAGPRHFYRLRIAPDQPDFQHGRRQRAARRLYALAGRQSVVHRLRLAPRRLRRRHSIGRGRIAGRCYLPAADHRRRRP